MMNGGEIKKGISTILIFALSLLLVTAVLIIISPKPTTILIRRLFEGEVAVKPDSYDEIQQMTRSYNNISYKTIFRVGYSDIIAPKEFSDKLPMIFWGARRSILGRR